MTTTAIRFKVTGDLFHGQVPAGVEYVGRSMPGGLTGSPYANPHSASKKGCRTCGRRIHTPAQAVMLFRFHLMAAPRAGRPDPPGPGRPGGGLLVSPR